MHYIRGKRFAKKVYIKENCIQKMCILREIHNEILLKFQEDFLFLMQNNLKMWRAESKIEGKKLKLRDILKWADLPIHTYLHLNQVGHPPNIDQNNVKKSHPVMYCIWHSCMSISA